MKEIKVGDILTRDFNYVEDTCRGFIELAGSESIGETINVGSNSEISISDLIETIKDLMESDVKFVQDEQRINQ